jgi:DNA-binding transcriptional LysR family regulator
MLDLDAVVTFVEVARRGSFLAASVAKNLTPSAISKKVARLESDLGARLINRSTHELTLTEAGAIFLERANKILNEVQLAKASVAEATHTLSGTLRIHLTPGTGHRIIAPILLEFMKLHPQITFSITVNPTVVDLLEEGFDLSIRRVNATEKNLASTSIDGVQLASAEYRICATNEYFSEHGTPEVPGDLVQHNCLIYSRHDAPRQWWFHDEVGTLYPVQVAGTLISDDWTIIHEATRAGLGVARLHQAEWHGLSGLISIFTDLVESNRTLWAYFPRMRSQPRKLTELIDFIRKRMEGVREG